MCRVTVGSAEGRCKLIAGLPRTPGGRQQEKAGPSYHQESLQRQLSPDSFLFHIYCRHISPLQSLPGLGWAGEVKDGHSI